LPERTLSMPLSRGAPTLPRLTLVLGGARSGKSAYAETLIEEASPRAIYLATAEVLDEEMAARIRHHRARRGAGWTTIEAPLDLIPHLRGDPPFRIGQPILVDCLTLWLSNLYEAGRVIETEIDTLLAALDAAPSPVVMVANEVGLGIVPENALARAFRDSAGRLNQAIAARAERVVFLAAGCPLILKDAKGVS